MRRRRIYEPTTESADRLTFRVFRFKIRQGNEMEPGDIEKKLAEFKAASQGIKKSTTQPVKPKPVPAAPSPEEMHEFIPPVVAGGPCFSKCFKSLMVNIQPGFVGHDTFAIIQDLVNNQFPECGVAA